MILMTTSAIKESEHPSLLDDLSAGLHYALECLREADKALEQIYALDQQMAGESLTLSSLRGMCDWMNSEAFSVFYEAVYTAQASCAELLSNDPDPEEVALTIRYAKPRGRQLTL